MIERKISGREIAVIATLFTAGCTVGEKIGSDTQVPLAQPPRSTQDFQTPDSLPAATETLIQTPTLTSTPTPNWVRINEEKMEASLEGESLRLDNIVVDRVLVINPPLAKEYIFGLVTNQVGETQAIIENFDCQYMVLREGGALGEKLERKNILLPADIWQSNAEFGEIEVVKSGEFGEIEVFTSQSFVSRGEKHTCEEHTSWERLSDTVKRLIQRTLDSF